MSAPMRPGDVPRDASLGLLGYRYSHHHRTLATDVLLTDPEVTEHALAALSYGTVVAERVESGRWSTALDALTAGAGLERTAAAMDLDASGLRVGLALWVSEQHRLGLIDADRYAQVVHLIREEPT